MKKHFLFLAAMAALVSAPFVASAADHIDSPAAVAEPTADITDLYAWMTPDAQNLNLVLNVNPFAGNQAAFSDAVQYAFHVNSSTGYGEPQTETLVLCRFPTPDIIECWVGDEYIIGDARDPMGLESESGDIKIFAGMRNDPFFMEFSGFTETVNTVIGAASALSFDQSGCPAVDAATSGVLVNQLQSGVDGIAAADTFAGQNVLSMVIQVNRELVNTGGPILGVWASTHIAN